MNIFNTTITDITIATGPLALTTIWALVLSSVVGGLTAGFAWRIVAAVTSPNAGGGES